MKKMTVYLHTLGCPKNLVDAEYMAGQLEDADFLLTVDPAKADIIVINTCGFIQSAKEEAIEHILFFADYKKPTGKCDYLLVTGCLSQRYPSEILESMPEVDAVLGTAHYAELAEAILQLYKEDEPRHCYVSDPAENFLDHFKSRRLMSTKGYAYLKIAEGCSNACAYCAIPMIRGPYRSRPMEDIIAEATWLLQSGYKELILTAQDTSAYGHDLYGSVALSELLFKLSAISGDFNIRLMYAYPSGITPSLVDAMKNSPKVLHYIDLPIQHADDRVLRSMRRKDNSDTIARAFSLLRSYMPDIVIRTTVMVGFPGEDKKAFDNLLRSLKAWAPDYIGCFVFSPEENTLASTMTPRVRSDVARRRYQRVMDLSEQIMLHKHKSRIGATEYVMIEGVSDDGLSYLGKSCMQAPDVDPIVFVYSSKGPLMIGETYRVRYVDCTPYDLTGEVIYEHSE